MAPPAGTLRVGRYFAALFALFALLYLVVFLPGHRHTPKLGLDLVGGREIIYQAVAPGGKTPTSAQMEQSKQIMEERVNASGTTGATVVIEGDDRIDIQIPGGTDTDVEALGKAAVLNFRPLVAPAVGIACRSASATGSPTGSGAPSASSSGSGSAAPSSSPSSAPSSPAPTRSANGLHERPLNAAATTSPAAATSTAPSSPAGSSGGASATPLTTPSGSAAAPSSPAAVPPCVGYKSVLAASGLKTLPSTEAAYQALTQAQKTAVASAVARFDCNSTTDEPDLKSEAYVACDTTGQIGYLLGQIIVPGNQIDNAAAEAPSVSGQGSVDWSVRLELKDSGSSAWSKWTSAHNIGGAGAANVGGPDTCGTTTPCANFVGFTLDGRVISAPVTETAINNTPTSITGGFDQKGANTLADQLNFGALPTSFKLEFNENISATLGSAQLRAGLLAGGIGLILVVIYSLLYYRALGLVTIASLIVSGGLTWASLVILGNQIGYSLDLAGIAGFIVAIGITADSFVVFFERIKDEVHEGRSVRVAVPRAWSRARRTILSADTVSFLAAAILYYFAAGEVRGFAFTLGLSTVLDLIVVFLFTHPLVSLLSRSRAFGSARFTGLNSVRDGGVVSSPDDRPARRQRPARRSAGSARPARSATAVLDERATDTDTVEADDAVDDDDAVDAGSADASGHDTDDAAVEETSTVPADTDATDAADTDDEPPAAPRKRSTPAAGSAAERAAARRARMKQRQDDEGSGR